MTHPFGELLRQHRARKSSLTLARLAHAMGYNEAVVTRMAQGKKDLTGPSGRDRVISLIHILHEEGVLSTVNEANSLMTAAALPPLYEGLPQEAALLRLLEPAPAHIHHQPISPISTLIGRDREILEIQTHVHNARLVTLIGAGGSGKTRLAIEVAARVHSSLVHGACFISLAAITQVNHVATTMIESLDIAPIFDLPPREILIRYLRDKTLLLILDNFEHVLDAAPLVTDLLAALPTLTILITSREPLRLTGEQLYPVEPLEQGAAIQLFLARARAMWPHFTPSPSDLSAIEIICRQLDHLPLAIELAAARIRQFPPKHLLERLSPPATSVLNKSDSLQLLTQGPRDVPARQQTLRETIEWSYRLLTPDEQHIFRALAVFAGGVAIEQLNQVVQGTYSQMALSLEKVASIVHALIDKNLVRADPPSAQEARFGMLELIREFALDKLVATGEFEAARGVHAEAFSALAEQAKPHIMGATPFTQEPWVERMQREADNIRSMMTWSLSPKGNPICGLRLVAALNWYLRAQTHTWEQDGFNWVNQLCTRPLQNPPVAALAWATMLRGFPPCHGTASIAFSEASLRYAQQSEEDDCIANAIISLGVDLNHYHCDGRGTPLIEQGLALARKVGYSFLISYGLHYLGQARMDYENRPEAAMSLFEESITFAEANNHYLLAMPTLLMAGACALHQLNFDRALALADRAQGKANLLGWDTCDYYRIKTEAWLGIGNPARAREYVRQGYDVVSHFNNAPTFAYWLALMAKVALAAGERTEVSTLLARSWDQFESALPEVGGLIDLLENLHLIPANILEVSACLASACGEFTQAAQRFGAGATIRAMHRVPREPYCERWHTHYIAQARIALSDKDYDAAYDRGQMMSFEQALNGSLHGSNS